MAKGTMILQTGLDRFPSKSRVPRHTALSTSTRSGNHVDSKDIPFGNQPCRLAQCYSATGVRAVRQSANQLSAQVAQSSPQCKRFKQQEPRGHGARSAPSGVRRRTESVRTEPIRQIRVASDHGDAARGPPQRRKGAIRPGPVGCSVSNGPCCADSELDQRRLAAACRVGPAPAPLRALGQWASGGRTGLRASHDPRIASRPQGCPNRAESPQRLAIRDSVK